MSHKKHSRPTTASYRNFVRFIVLQGLFIPAAAFADLLPPKGNLHLLQPLDDSTTSLPPSPNIQIFFQYFNLAWPWVLGIAAGIGVLWGIVGGIEIMIGGSDSGASGGKEKIKHALMGLLMVGLAGFILRSLNSIFYQ